MDVQYKKVLPNYTYAASTANGNLRTHLESYHEEEYVRVCEEKSWTIQLPKRKRRLELANALRQSTLANVAVPGKAVNYLYLG